jgi:hypothetical protein
MAMSRPRKASAYNLTARRARTPSRVSLSRPADGLTVQISTRELIGMSQSGALSVGVRYLLRWRMGF